MARTVTDSQGRQLAGLLLAADGASVTFRREADGKEFTLKLDQLSKADREFIAQWKAGKLLKSEQAWQGAWSWAIKPQYEAAGRFVEGLAPVKQGGKWGFIDEAGKLVIPLRYAGVLAHRDGFLLHLEDGKSQSYKLPELYELAGLKYTPKPAEAVAPAPAKPSPGGEVNHKLRHEYPAQKLSWVEPLPDDLEWLGLDPYAGVMQLIDSAGNVLIPPGCVNYNKTKPDLNGLFPHFQERKFGVVDHTGKVVVPPAWDGALTAIAQGGLIAVLKGKSVQYLDRTGKPTAQKPSAAPWEDSQGWKADYEKTAKKWGFKDAAGKFVLGPEWEELQMAYGTKFTDGLAGAKQGGRWGFIDRTGKIVIPFEYGKIGPFSNGLAAVRKDGKFGYVDAKGALVVPSEWDGAEPFENGVARVNRGGKDSKNTSYQSIKGGLWGLVDKSGKVLAQPEWSDVRGLSRNRAWVSKDAVNGKLGGAYALLDTASGKLLTGFEWSDWHNNGDFSTEGLLLSRRGGLYGYLDAQGKVVIEPQYAAASQFRHGAAVVWPDADSSDGSGLIDAKGGWLFKSRPGAQLARPTGKGSLFTDHFHHGLALIEETGPWGFVRLNVQSQPTTPK